MASGATSESLGAHNPPMGAIPNRFSQNAMRPRSTSNRVRSRGAAKFPNLPLAEEKDHAWFLQTCSRGDQCRRC